MAGKALTSRKNLVNQLPVACVSPRPVRIYVTSIEGFRAHRPKYVMCLRDGHSTGDLAPNRLLWTSCAHSRPASMKPSSATPGEGCRLLDVRFGHLIPTVEVLLFWTSIWRLFRMRLCLKLRVSGYLDQKVGKIMAQNL